MGSTLILLRHGQSTGNLENRYTGWIDYPLSQLGREEALQAGRLLRTAGASPAVLHTSVLLRAIQTAEITLQELSQSWLPVRRSWRLNGRHYGAFQGLHKDPDNAAVEQERTMAWRRSYEIAPPPLSSRAEASGWTDPLYADISPDLIPATESLKDVVGRTLPYWYDHIVPDLRKFRSVLVVAHVSSLRALMRHLEQITDDEIVNLDIPTGVPRVYQFDEHLEVTEAINLGDLSAAGNSVADESEGI